MYRSIVFLLAVCQVVSGMTIVNTAPGPVTPPVVEKVTAKSEIVSAVDSLPVKETAVKSDLSTASVNGNTILTEVKTIKLDDKDKVIESVKVLKDHLSEFERTMANAEMVIMKSLNQLFPSQVKAFCSSYQTLPQ